MILVVFALMTLFASNLARGLRGNGKNSRHGGEQNDRRQHGWWSTTTTTLPPTCICDYWPTRVYETCDNVENCVYREYLDGAFVGLYCNPQMLDVLSFGAEWITGLDRGICREENAPTTWIDNQSDFDDCKAALNSYALDRGCQIERTRAAPPNYGTLLDLLLYNGVVYV